MEGKGWMMDLKRFDNKYLDAYESITRNKSRRTPPPTPEPEPEPEELFSEASMAQMEVEVDQMACNSERADSECDFHKEYGRTILRGVNNQTESSQNLYF